MLEIDFHCQNVTAPAVTSSDFAAIPQRISEFRNQEFSINPVARSNEKRV